MSSVNGTTNSSNSSKCYATSCMDIQLFSLIYLAVLLVDAVMSFLSNIAIVWLLLRGKVGTLISDLFSLGLAFNEIVVSSLTFCLILVYFLKNVVFVINPAIAISAFILITRPLFQCCICVERYLAVVHPVTYLKYKALRYRLVCLGAIWSLSVGISVIRVYVQSYLFSWATFISCMAINSFCSISILRTLKKPHPGDGKRDEMNLMKRRAFRTVLVILVMTVVNYLPILILRPLSMFSCMKHYCIIYIAAAILLVNGNMVHPLLYFSRLCKLPGAKHSQVTSHEKCHSVVIK